MKKRKKHSPVKITLADKKLAESPEVKKLVAKLQHKLAKEAEARMLNMLTYGTSHPEILK